MHLWQDPPTSHFSFKTHLISPQNRIHFPKPDLSPQNFYMWEAMIMTTETILKLL